MRCSRARVVFLVSALALAAAPHEGLAHADEPRPGVANLPVPLDAIVAIVDDVIIFRSDIATRVRHFESKLSSDPRTRRTELAELTKVILTHLVDEVLIAKDAARLHIEATEAEVAAGIATVATANKMDRKQLEAEVASAGYSPADYQDEIRRQILEQKWLVLRAAGRIDRKKARDPASFQSAFEKQRELIVAELRTHAYVEIR